MTKGKVIGIAILSGVAVFGYALYAYAKRQAMLLENYEYKIVDFKMDTFDLQKIKKVGYIEDTTPFVIPAKGYTTIPFKYTLNPQLVINNAVDIVSYALRQKDAAISVRGYAKLKSGFVSATLPISYDTTIKEILAD